MDEKMEFLKRLDEIAEKGLEKGGFLLREEVKSQFQEVELTQEQMELIGEYLLTKQVILEGVQPKEIKPKEEPVLTPAEEGFLNQYREELEGIKKYSMEERKALAAQVQNGKGESAQLSEAMLAPTLSIALEYVGGKVLVGDLIQEANLALLLGVAELPDTKEEAMGFLEKRIRLGVEGILFEETDMNLEGKKVAEKLNALTDAITELTEELGTEVSPENLAEHIGMSIEEIENLIKLAGEV
ncbi:MAG: sigma-70 domain-containing protein [Lachnospiraceae bacterium]